MDEKIIPFGKYKGKPVEILATDKNYAEWLIAQSFFKEKHVNLYNVVINNFREPVDTPEHNKLQIKFLKPEYRVKLAYIVNPNLFEYNSEKINREMNKILDKTDDKKSEYFLNSLKNPEKNHKYGLYTTRLMRYSTPVFESVDANYCLWYGIKFDYDGLNSFNLKRRSEYWVEIKPTISEDFPSVLRQMKASMPYQYSEFPIDKFFILLVGEYTGTSVSKTDFIEYFKTQGYIVVFENQIEQVELLNFDRELILDEKIKERIKHSD